MSGNGEKREKGGRSGAREKEGKVVPRESKNHVNAATSAERRAERGETSLVETIEPSIKRQCQLSANGTGFCVRIEMRANPYFPSGFE
jgi:hypothetical protein